MVAHRYFLDHGYAGTTMSGIAAALGGSKGTLWNHFPSKQDLFAAVLDRATIAYRAELSQILDPCGELAPTLRRACVSLIQKVTSPDAIALQRLIIAEGSRFPEVQQIFFELAPKHTRALLSRFLDGAMDRGEVRRVDAQDAARALIALTQAGAHQQLLMGHIAKPTEAQMAADVDFAIDLFLRAYTPAPPTPAGQSA